MPEEIGVRSITKGLYFICDFFINSTDQRHLYHKQDQSASYDIRNLSRYFQAKMKSLETV